MNTFLTIFLIIITIFDITVTLWLLLPNFISDVKKEDGINGNDCNRKNKKTKKHSHGNYFLTKEKRYKKIVEEELDMISRYLDMDHDNLLLTCSSLSFIRISDDDLAVFLNLSVISKNYLKLRGFDFIQEEKTYYLKFDYTNVKLESK